MKILKLLLILSFAGASQIGELAISQEVIAKRTLRVGNIIRLSDIEGDIDNLRDYGEYLGMEVRRPYYAGQIISIDDLGPPTLVKRNDVVTVIYNTTGLGLRTIGRALGAGGAGEWIDVINLQTKLRIRGRVLGRGKVEVIR